MAIIDVTELFPLVDLTYRQPYTSKDAITDLVAHYTVTSMPATATRLEETEHLRGIYEFHVVGRGYGGIGYHGIGFPSGRAYKTAPWDRWGANVAGENGRILGFAGVFEGDIVPPAGVLDAFRALIVAADSYLGGRLRPTKGHRDFMATGCPGGKWQEWVPGLRQEDDMGMTPTETAAFNALKTDLAATKTRVADLEKKPYCVRRASDPTVYFVAGGLLISVRSGAMWDRLKALGYCGDTAKILPDTDPVWKSPRLDF